MCYSWPWKQSVMKAGPKNLQCCFMCMKLEYGLLKIYNAVLDNLSFDLFILSMC